MSENLPGARHDDPDMNQGSSRFPNPYVGPRPLNRNESQKLGGRDKEIEQLLDLLVAERIVLLHAPSGAGKTSLIDAGLRNRLVEEEDFWVSDMLSVNRPPNDPAILDRGEDEVNRFILSLLISLEKAKEDQPDESQLSHEELATLTLSEYLDNHLTKQVEDRDIVLVFDQFEEILTVEPYDISAKRVFFDQVGKALRKRTRWALFAARADYLYGFERYERAIPTRFSNTFGLRLLGHDAAIDAIQKPATTVLQTGALAETPGYTGCIRFDADAAEHVVTNLMQGTPYVEPVLLQVVCRDLWHQLSETDRLEDGDINLDDAQAMTNVDVALKVYYANSLAGVARTLCAQSRDDGRLPDAALAGEDMAAPSRGTDLQERQIREWVGEKLLENGIRTQVQVNTEDTVAGIAEALEGVYLVRKDERRGSFWYELAHDRLIRPIQEDNEAWFESKLEKVQKRARSWRGSKDPGFLLDNSEGDLDEALAWAQLNELTENERAFLEASESAEKARLRELRLGRTISIISGVLGVVGIILFGFVVFFFVRSSRDRLELRLNNQNTECGSDEASVSAGENSCQRAIQLATLNDWVKEPRDWASDSWREKALANPLTDAEQISLACMNGLLHEAEEEWQVLAIKACKHGIGLASGLTGDLDILSDPASINDLQNLIDPRASQKLDVLNDLCSFTLDRELGPAVLLNACSLAMNSTTSITDASELDQVNLACQNGLIAGSNVPQLSERDGYAEQVKQACRRAAVLAEKSPSLVQRNQACQNAIAAKLDQKFVIEPSCLDAIALGKDEDTADLIQLNLACQNGLIADLALPDIQPICWQAVRRASSSDNLVQVNRACQNALSTELISEESVARIELPEREVFDVVEKACLRGAELALEESTDLVQMNLACQNVLNAGLTTPVVRQACEDAAEIAFRRSEDLVQVNIACENAFILGEEKGQEEEDLVNVALVNVCGKAVDLAAKSATDIAQINLACRSGLNVSIDAVPACGKAVEIAANSENFILANQACENGLEAGIGDRGEGEAEGPSEDSLGNLESTCRRADELSDVSTNLNQVKVACENSHGLGLDGRVACNRLERLVLNSDLAVAYDLCVANTAEPWSMHPIQSACPRVISLATDNYDLETLEQVCRNGLQPGSGADIVLSACQEAASLVQDAPDRLIGLCGHALDVIVFASFESFGGDDPRFLDQADDICQLALSAAESLDAGDEKGASEGISGDFLEICIAGGRTGRMLGDWHSEACQRAIAELNDDDRVTITGNDMVVNANLRLGLADIWPFNGRAGEIVTIKMARESDELDPYLVLSQIGGDVLTENDDTEADDGGTDIDARIDYTLRDDGYYLIEARNLREEPGRYTLTLEQVTFAELAGGAKSASEALNYCLSALDFSATGGTSYADDVSVACARADELGALSGNVQAGLRLCSFSNSAEPLGSLATEACNNALASAELIEVAEATEAIEVTGEIQAGLSAFYAFDGEAGLLVDITMTRDPDDELDPFLYLYGPDGELLAEDDDGGGDLDSWIDQYQLEESGRFVIEAFSLGGGSGAYTLGLDLGTFAETIFVSEDLEELLALCGAGSETDLRGDERRRVCQRAGELAAESMDILLVSDMCLNGQDTGLQQERIDAICRQAAFLSIEENNTLIGYQLCSLESDGVLLDEVAAACSTAKSRIGDISPGDTLAFALGDDAVDYYGFENEGNAGQVVRLAMNQGALSDVDPLVRIFSESGKQITQDNNSGVDSNSLLDFFVLGGDATYLIEVSSFEAASGNYILTLDLIPLDEQVEQAINSESPRKMNQICWYGSLAGFAEQVIPACQRAVELAQENNSSSLYNYRDSRGLARALTGDLEGAIEDFLAYIEVTSNDDGRQKREAWIVNLESGQSPFGDQVLEELLTN